MRKIGAVLVIVIFGALICAPSPGAAFSLRLGPIRIGLPYFGHRHRHHHRFFARRSAPRTASRREQASGPAPSQTPPTAFLFPALALPAVYDNVFWPPQAQWPFGYDAIFATAFAKTGPQEVNRCQRPERADAVVERITREVKPSGVQLQQLQKLGGALGYASGYLAKTCPNQIPAQPVARLQLMEWQVENLAKALEIVRQPLQDFEQSLNADQRARLAPAQADRANDQAPACAAPSASIDRSVEQISASVQPTDAQKDAMAGLKRAFQSAASELAQHCPLPAPSAVARLDAVEARLDATWRALVSIQVELADFAGRLSNEQRVRFDATDFAAAQ